MLNPWQALLLGQNPDDPRTITQMGAPAPQGQAPNAAVAPSLSGNDDGGAAAAPASPGAGAPNAGFLGAVAAPTASSVQPNPADQIDPNSGSRVGDLQQGLLATLGQLGPILMAAGQRMSPAQRAQILTMGAAAIGGGPRNVLNAAQARLMQQKASNEDASAKRLNAALASMAQDPNVPASIKQMMMADPSGALKLWAERNNPAQTALDQELALAAAAGKTPAQFYADKFERDDKYSGHIVNGVPMSMNGRTGEWAVSGNAPPNPVAAMVGAAPGGQPGAAPGGQPAPGQVPGQIATPTNTSAQFAPPNVADAFGSQTWLAMHAKDPLYRALGWERTPEAQARETAMSQINTLHGDLAGVLAEGLPGQKSNDARKAIMNRLPPVAAITTDPSSALNMYKGIYNEVEARAQQAQRAALLNMQTGQQGRANEYANEYQDARRVQQNLASVMNGLASNIQGKPYNPTADAARAQLGGRQGAQIPDVVARARQIVGRGNGQ